MIECDQDLWGIEMKGVIWFVKEGFARIDLLQDEIRWILWNFKDFLGFFKDFGGSKGFYKDFSGFLEILEAFSILQGFLRVFFGF